MKFTQLIIGCLYAALFFSCDEERIQFSEPQPAQISADGEIRADYLGKYFCEEDSTWLSISAKTVTRSTEDLDEIKKGNRVEVKGASHARIELGRDSAPSVQINITADQNSDSLAFNSNFEEHLFDLGHGDIPKYYRRYYFLNTRNEAGNGFHLRILRKTKEGLLLCRIQTDSVLHVLEKEGFISKKAIEETNDELWTLQPSKKQLKKLIESGLFSDVKLYRKIKR